MTEQWQELKETIIELRDNDGAGTQQEVCKFLANLMDVLEKQMSDSENPNKCFDGITNREIISEFVERDDSFAIMVDEVNETVNIELSLDFWNTPYTADREVTE